MPGVAVRPPAGPESFAEAGKSAGPRIVVFEVVRIIDLTESTAKRSPHFF
jgi:hypothetical protein